MIHLMAANMRAAKDPDILQPLPLLDQDLQPLHKPLTNHPTPGISVAVAAPAYKHISHLHEKLFEHID